MRGVECSNIVLAAVAIVLCLWCCLSSYIDKNPDRNWNDVRQAAPAAALERKRPPRGIKIFLVWALVVNKILAGIVTRSATSKSRLLPRWRKFWAAF
jgi:hypothetical protein